MKFETFQIQTISNNVYLLYVPLMAFLKGRRKESGIGVGFKPQTSHGGSVDIYWICTRKGLELANRELVLRVMHVVHCTCLVVKAF